MIDVVIVLGLDAAVLRRCVPEKIHLFHLSVEELAVHFQFDLLEERAEAPVDRAQMLGCSIQVKVELRLCNRRAESRLFRRQERRKVLVDGSLLRAAPGLFCHWSRGVTCGRARYRHDNRLYSCIRLRLYALSEAC